MDISGQLKVHKSDGVTKDVSRAKILNNGELAVWEYDSDGEPDIIVSASMWKRIERNGANWRTNMKSVIKQAEERDDVDVDQIKDLRL